MQSIDSVLRSDAHYYTESEIAVFTVIDINGYNKILNRIRDDPALRDNIEYEKCLCHGHSSGASVRAKVTCRDAICPVAFAEHGRYEYKYDVKMPCAPRKRHAIPVWCENHMSIVSATSRVSREYEIDAGTFVAYANEAPNDIDGSGRKDLLTDRIVISRTADGGAVKRFSINKKCKFSGNGIFRQPDVPVYILEYEIELSDPVDIENKLNINSVCHEYIKVCKDKLSLSADEIYRMMRCGLTNCLPENDLFLSIFNTFKRNFAAAALPQRLDDRERAYICPKWDGVRATGFWRDDSLLLYSCQFGFKYFPGVPRIFAPDLICQVEYFPSSDTFIVTEIYACVNIEMDTDFVYFMRKSGNACRFGEGLYNGSNTSVQMQDNRRYLIVDVNPVDSMSCIDYLNTKYPRMFTFHRRILEWPPDADGIMRQFADVIAGTANADRETDGVLLKIMSVYKPPVYFKLKRMQTVELTYSPDTGSFTSSDRVCYDSIIIDADRFELKYQRNLCDVSNVARTMEFFITKPERGLLFKCVRIDKIEPDSDDKIRKLFDLSQ